MLREERDFYQTPNIIGGGSGLEKVSLDHKNFIFLLFWE